MLAVPDAQYETCEQMGRRQGFNGAELGQTLTGLWKTS